ncbi:MAG: sigma-70 family RNA polymerase sigma factor [Deltaproteobacteria bacterium]|nr:sigma-70 family RNA polymerase sigma factor [Deltaproteobacteria bacterium]
MSPLRETTPTDDAVLVERARDGQPGAFEALVRRHSGRVYRLALRMTGSAQDAEEITQETFLSAHQGLARFRGEAAVTSWLHRIAANFALMRLRHRRISGAAEEQLTQSVGPHEDRAPPAYPIAQASVHTEQHLLDVELRRAIEQAVDRLPDEYRVVFLLRDVEDLSYEEIAEATSSTVPAIKSRLHRARLALRQAIQDFYAEHPR